MLYYLCVSVTSVWLYLDLGVEQPHLSVTLIELQPYIKSSSSDFFWKELHKMGLFITTWLGCLICGSWFVTGPKKLESPSK